MLSVPQSNFNQSQASLGYVTYLSPRTGTEGSSYPVWPLAGKVHSILAFSDNPLTTLVARAGLASDSTGRMVPDHQDLGMEECLT